MQRDGETNLQRLIGQFTNLRGKTTCRDRNVSSADAETPRRVDDLNGAHHVLQVCEGFAHSREKDVVDLLGGISLGHQDVIDNYARAQISREPLQAARAKFAAVSATDLGRNANCSAIRPCTIKGG